MQPAPATASLDVAEVVAQISRIAAVPTILDVICRTTGMRFAAVAHVTSERWIACSVLDHIDFGLRPGGELPLETTICNEIRQSREPVVIDHVAEDASFCKHPTPAQYGFQSYISMPIILRDGTFFGTLCSIDPRPARLNTPETIGMFQLFASLIAQHLDIGNELKATSASLVKEREIADLREQFMAVLSHDLRAPLRAVNCFTELLVDNPSAPDAPAKARLVRDNVARMQQLIDDLMDLARGRHLGGIPIDYQAYADLEPVLREVIAGYSIAEPSRSIEANLCLSPGIACDPQRIAQLFSNLLGNALKYGDRQRPVRVFAGNDEDALELWVANEGDPIPKEVQAHLFEPFYRSSVARSRDGLGLGLYIAHEIARAHEGTLTLTSTSEETRFTLRMPAKKSVLESVRHQCMIYQGSPTPHLAGLAKVMVKKLRANLRVLCLNSPSMIAGIESSLAAAGMDVAVLARQGSLILSSDDSHLVGGSFHPDRMIALLDGAVTQALQDGYAGLWAAGDMTWELGPEKNYEKLQHYERELEALIHRRPELQGICQYHVDTLPEAVTAQALQFHQACYINETLSRLNRHQGAKVVTPSHWRAMLATQADAHPAR